MQEISTVNRSADKIHWDTLSFLSIFHILSIPAFFTFSWQNLAALLIVNWMSGSLGVGIGYHRLLTHGGFKAQKWLKYTLVTLGTLSMQHGPLKWATTHRIHHAHTDTPNDPHTPRDGSFWAHVGWTLRGTALENDLATTKRFAPDLLKDKYIVWLSNNYYLPIITSGFVLYLIGGWSMVVWGVFFRTVVGWHSTWLVNSFTHGWGSRRFDTHDDSTNSFIIAILTFGEGWHNNHHAHPSSARHGLAWYEFDQNWLTIKLFERLGWVKQIRVYRAEKAVHSGVCEEFETLRR